MNSRSRNLPVANRFTAYITLQEIPLLLSGLSKVNKKPTPSISLA